MSKIAVSPNGSGTGTYTLASPNNNASHTITLPVATGELLVNTSTGVSVTGTVTADSLAVDGDVSLGGSANAFGTTSTSAYILRTGSGGSAPFTQAGSLVYQPRTSTTDGRSNHLFYTGDPLALRMNIQPTGDVSFYEDTGTTPKFFWDASAEALGVGTAAPDSYYAKKLVVDCGTDGQNGITIKSSTTGAGMFAFADGTSGSDRYRGYINYNHADDSMTLGTAGGSGTVSVSSTGVISGDGSGLTNLSGPSTTAGAVGTYAWLVNRTQDNGSAWGGTMAGSSLGSAGLATNNNTNASSSGNVTASGRSIGTTQTGTWRAMGQSNFSGMYDSRTTLFVRIA